MEILFGLLLLIILIAYYIVGAAIMLGLCWIIAQILMRLVYLIQDLRSRK